MEHLGVFLRKENEDSFYSYLTQHWIDAEVVHNQEQLKSDRFTRVLVDCDNPIDGVPEDKQIHLGFSPNFTNDISEIIDLSGIVKAHCNQSNAAKLFDRKAKSVELLEIAKSKKGANIDPPQNLDQVWESILVSTTDAENEKSQASDLDDTSSNLDPLATESATGVSDPHIALETTIIEESPSDEMSLGDSSGLNENLDEPEKIVYPMHAAFDDKLQTAQSTLELNDRFENAEFWQRKFKAPDIPKVEIVHGRGIRVRLSHTISRRIYLVYGATPLCGASTLAYSLALALAKNSPNTLLCDLDILKPEMTKSLFQANTVSRLSSASIESIFRIDWESYLAAIMSFVKEFKHNDVPFYFIGGSNNESLQVNMQLRAYNYGPFLYYLSNRFNPIVVDMGRFESTSAYQLYMMRENYLRSFIVYSCATTKALKDGFIRTQNIPFNVGAILNNTTKLTNKYMLEKELQRPVVGEVKLIKYLKNQGLDKSIQEFTGYNLDGWESLVTMIGGEQ